MQQNQKPADFLIATYCELHAQVRANQDLEYKVSFAVAGFFIAFSAVVLRHNFGDIKPAYYMVLGAFVFTLGSIVITFIYNNFVEMKWQCRQIVNCELAMGLYDLDKYMVGRAILPEEAKAWGDKKGSRFNSLPFLFGIAVSVLSAETSIYLSYATATGSESEKKGQEVSQFQTDLAAVENRIKNDVAAQLSRHALQTTSVLASKLDKMNAEIVALPEAIAAALHQQAAPSHLRHRHP